MIFVCMEIRNQQWVELPQLPSTLYLYFKKYFVVLCVCLHICLHILHMLSALRSQTMALDSLELQMVVRHYVGAGDLPQFLWKRSQCSEPLNNLPSPLYLVSWAWISHWTWVSSILGWLSSKLKRSSCLCLSTTDFSLPPQLAFTWVLGINLRFMYFVASTLPTKPSP